MIFGSSTRRERPSRWSRAARASADPVVDGELPPKLVPSLRALISTGTSLLHTRLALAGIELEEEVQRIIGAAVLALLALMAGSLALIVGTFTIVAAVAPDHRVLTMVIITVVYLMAAVLLVVRIKTIFSTRPPIFSGTLAELEKDKETWSQMARAHDAAEEARETAERAAREAERDAAAAARLARRARRAS